MSWTVTAGTAVCCGTARTLCEHGPAQHGKYARGDDQTHKPGAAEDAVLGQFGAAREQDGKDNQDGDGADVDENLRKAGELRVKLEEQQRQAAKATVTASTQWTRFLSNTAARPPASVRAASR